MVDITEQELLDLSQELSDDVLDLMSSLSAASGGAQGVSDPSAWSAPLDPTNPGGQSMEDLVKTMYYEQMGEIFALIELEVESGAYDPNAIHDNEDDEIHQIAQKAVPVAADEVVIEDSENAWAKRRVPLSALGGAVVDPNAIHDNVANEILPIALKAVPLAADPVLIEDTAAANVKKHTTAGAIAALGGGPPAAHDFGGALHTPDAMADVNTRFTDGSINHTAYTLNVSPSAADNLDYSTLTAALNAAAGLGLGAAQWCVIRVAPGTYNAETPGTTIPDYVKIIGEGGPQDVILQPSGAAADLFLLNGTGISVIENVSLDGNSVITTNILEHGGSGDLITRNCRIYGGDPAQTYSCYHNEGTGSSEHHHLYTDATALGNAWNIKLDSGAGLTELWHVDLNNGTVGIYAFDSQIIAHDLNITSCTSYGMSNNLAGCDAEVHGGTIHSCGIGVSVSNSLNVRVHDVKFDSCTTAAVYFPTATGYGHFYNCDFDGNTEDIFFANVAGVCNLFACSTDPTKWSLGTAPGTVRQHQLYGNEYVVSVGPDSEHGFTTVSDAITYVDGLSLSSTQWATILVSPGLYTETAKVSVPGYVEIKGTGTHPDDVIIRQTSPAISAFDFDAAYPVAFSNLTIDGHGNVADNGIVLNETTKLTLRDVRITNFYGGSVEITDRGGAEFFAHGLYTSGDGYGVGTTTGCVVEIDEYVCGNSSWGFDLGGGTVTVRDLVADTGGDTFQLSDATILTVYDAKITSAAKGVDIASGVSTIKFHDVEFLSVTNECFDISVASTVIYCFDVYFDSSISDHINFDDVDATVHLFGGTIDPTKWDLGATPGTIRVAEWNGTEYLVRVSGNSRMGFATLEDAMSYVTHYASASTPIVIEIAPGKYTLDNSGGASTFDDGIYVRGGGAVPGEVILDVNTDTNDAFNFAAGCTGYCGISNLRIEGGPDEAAVFDTNNLDGTFEIVHVEVDGACFVIEHTAKGEVVHVRDVTVTNPTYGGIGTTVPSFVYGPNGSVYCENVHLGDTADTWRPFQLTGVNTIRVEGGAIAGNGGQMVYSVTTAPYSVAFHDVQFSGFEHLVECQVSSTYAINFYGCNQIVDTTAFAFEVGAALTASCRWVGGQVFGDSFPGGYPTYSMGIPGGGTFAIRGYAHDADDSEFVVWNTADWNVAGIDNTAIHDNVANEIGLIAAKGTSSANDDLLIEDSGAAAAKKSIPVDDFLKRWFYSVDLYDQGGLTNITAGWTDLPWDQARELDASGYTQAGAGNEVIEIEETGRYIIHVDITTYVSSGSDRSGSECRIMYDSLGGGSYAMLQGTYAAMYNRDSTTNRTTGTIHIITDLVATDLLKIQAQRYDGTSTVLTYPEGTRWSIQRIPGQ